jgi:hypothetical protein
MNRNNRRVLTGRLLDYPLHPFLLALFPIFSLLATNIAELPVLDAIRSVFISFIGAILLFLFFYALLKDKYNSAWISSVILVLFFSYGHVYHFLETIQIAGFHPGRHRFLAPLYLLICGVAVWGIVKSKGNNPLLTRTLNVIAASVILLPLLQISAVYIQERTAENALPSQTPSLQVAEGQMLPDIYYIILDGYSRDDVLQEYFDLDNSTFLEGLSDLGFYVSHCSLSNYAQTQLSLASALNLNYIDALGMGFDENRTNRVGMPGLIKHSTIRAILEELGYTTVAFESGYYWTQIEDAGIYISPKSSAASLLDVTGGLNGFEALLVNNSAALILVDGTSALSRSLQANLDHPR